MRGLFEFECWHEDSIGEKLALQRYLAETPAKAKSSHVEYLKDGIWEEDFFTVVKHMKCRKSGVASINHFFGDRAQFERIKEARGIEFAYQGMKIEVCGKPGIIVGGNHSLNIDVVFDGTLHISNCHPWYETKYFDNKGNLIKDYCKKAVV